MEEVFYRELQFSSLYSHSIINLHQSYERLLLVSDEGISWPEFSHDSALTPQADNVINLSMNHCYVAHDSHCVVVYGIHTLKIKNRDFIYMLVASKLPSSRNYIIAYSMQATPYKIDKLQEFPVDYRPLAIIRASYDNKPIVVVTGSDGSVHAYEISPDGHLHRSRDAHMRSNVTARLGTNVKDSIILRLLYEEWDLGNQYVSAFANGRLHWNICVNQNVEWGDENDGVDLMKQMKQPKPLQTVFENDEELQYSYLLEGCICSVQFYSLCVEAPYASAGAESFDRATQSSSVVVALHSGHVALLSLSYDSLHAYRLPIEVSHGAAQALAVADVMQNGFNAIVSGFADGFVIVSAPVNPPTSSIDVSKISFAPVFSIPLPFPIMGLYYGQLLGQPQNEAELLYPQNQLITITSRGLHVHTR